MLSSMRANMMDLSQLHRISYQSGSPHRVTNCCLSFLTENEQDKNSLEWYGMASMTASSGIVFFFLRCTMSKIVHKALFWPLSQMAMYLDDGEIVMKLMASD